jgi:uncharacterized oxidoreductase
MRDHGGMVLRNRTILITGGTSGIGRALAEAFDRLGNTVVVCGRRAGRLAELTERSPGIVGIRCDLTDAAQRRELAECVVAEYPDLDMLINNAGVQLRFDVSRPVDLDRVRQELETNLVAPLHLTSLLAGHLAAQPDGTVINISSGLAFAPVAEVALYSASKAAIHSLTLSMRHQLRRAGVRVIEVAPPSVDTELGVDRRSDPTATHGGMPVAEFVEHTMAGLAAGSDEVLVGGAARIKAAPDEMFAVMNR